MLNKLYAKVTDFPKVVLFLVTVTTVFFGSQLSSLEWETDARVYMPKGHPAIIYDEKVEHLFGVKDALIICIVNDEKTIFNPETLEKITRITEKVAALPGVIANRTLDVASLSTATAFIGTDTSMGAVRLMESPPTTEGEIEQIRQLVYAYPDLFVGNIVSADGSAAMIRAKLKEGAVNRYQTYWQIKGILAAEGGAGQDWGGGQWSGEWQSDSGQWQGNQWSEQEREEWNKQEGGGQWELPQQTADGDDVSDDGDRFYLAGRPVIEVTSGLHAMQDMKMMIPLLLFVMAAALFLIFRTWRGVLLPLCVMGGAIVWTMGTMAVLDVPLYTISTMLPVILVAVGIGDSVHLLSNYYDNVFKDPHRQSPEIVREVLRDLGPPLITTSLTTGIGFLSLMFAEMPPFKIFGLFTVLGILYSWLLSITFLPAILVVLKPKVSGYLARRRSMRLHSEQDQLSRALVNLGRNLLSHRRPLAAVLSVAVVVAIIGSSLLYVNSSWLSDFKKDSEVVLSTDLLNNRFDGTIFLNIVVEGNGRDALKSPELLQRVEALQDYAESLPYVGDSLSVVDYLKSMNKTLHAEDDAYNVLPASRDEIAEYLYLYSISGQPELLDEVVDFDYQRANVSVYIKTDQTQALEEIIDKLNDYISVNFSEHPVTLNFAGSANNSYIWADLLINSQSVAIIFSKVAIFLLAALLFRSVWIALFTVIPVALTTLLIAGFAGWAGIPMDVSTALAAGVAIGVGVDYAVHYIFRYLREQRNGKAPDEAVLATLRSVGRTIVFNAVVVTAGFSILLLSQFPPHVKLGEFVVAYMIMSCIVALVVLPAFFRKAPAQSRVRSS